MSKQSGPDDYIIERLEKQLRWYGDKSAENKKKFHLFQTVIIATSALVPIVNTVGPAGDSLRIISSILGGIIVVVTSLIQLHKYQENWILYRTTAELLKKEKYLYLNDAGDYSGLDPSRKKKQLVERVEVIVSSETSKYFAIHKPEQQQHIEPPASSETPSNNR
jgi:Protein of unknown function (DUF4231)